MNEGSATLKPSVLDALRSRLRGTSLVRGDQGYDVARRVWNGAVDRHPSCIIVCADAEDVSHAVRIAAEPLASDRHSAASRSDSARHRHTWCDIERVRGCPHVHFEREPPGHVVRIGEFHRLGELDRIGGTLAGRIPGKGEMVATVTGTITATRVTIYSTVPGSTQ